MTNFDDIFESFLKQVEIDEYGEMTTDDLRNCLVEYCRHNISVLEVYDNSYNVRLQQYKYFFAVLQITDTVRKICYISKQERLDQNLSTCKIDMGTFIQKMINRRMSGLDITAIILGHMFELNIVTLFEKYIWKSVDVDLENFHVFFILMKGGVFASVTPVSKYKISVQLPTCCRHMFVLTSDTVVDEGTKEENFQFELAKRGREQYIII